MPKISHQLACGEVVKNFWKKDGKHFGFYSFSTSNTKYLTSQVFSIPRPSTGSTHITPILILLKIFGFREVFNYLTPLSTPPINKVVK